MKKILLLINIVFITLFHNNASAQGVIDSVIATQYIECPGEDGCLTVYTTGNDYTVVLQQVNTLLQMQTVATATFASSVEQFCGLSSGIYQVLLTDVNYTLPYPTGFNFDPNSDPGIFDAVTAILTEPLPLAVNLTAGNVSANGACDGWLNASVSGGTVPYTYLWDDNAVFPQTTQTATNLCGGTYCVTVTDTFGCSDTSCFSVIINQTYGCTDSTALNYNSNATYDDSTCYYCSMTTNVIPWLSSSLSACDGFISITPTSGSNPYTYIWSNGDTTNFNNNLCDGAYTYTVIDANGCGFTETIILTNYVGCTDHNAMNYDSTAIVDDGSCAYIIGCTDPTALNYNPSATLDDGSCIATVYGCTDSTATNYNPLANTDDGSCIPYVYGCTDSTATNYNATANTDDGTCTNCYAMAHILGDTITACDSILINTNLITNGTYVWSSSNISNPSVLSIGQYYQGGIVSYIDINGSNSLISAPFDQANTNTANPWGCDGSVISGADSTAIGTGNQNTIDIMNGCLTQGIAARICGDLVLNNYSDWHLPSKDELNQLYINRLLIGGFSGNNNSNYWTSTEQNGNQAWSQEFFNGNQSGSNKNSSAFYVRAVRYLSEFSVNSTTNTLMVTNSGWNYITVTDSLGCTATDSVYVHIDICGCTDSTALNYNPNATSDDGSCIATVFGCMDSTAIFYDPNATSDDGTCIYCDISISQLNQTDPTSGTCNGWIYVQATSSYPPITYTWSNGFVGVFNMSLCAGVYSVTITDTYGCSVDTTVSIGSGYGCTDTTAFNYDPSATINDSSCCYLAGCTDLTANNYNANACYDDNSCNYDVYGCTDPLASNYDSLATIADGSCMYCSVTLLNVVNANCLDSTGTITVEALGVGPFTYYLEINNSNNWSAFASVSGYGPQTFSNLPADTFRVIMVDSIGCSDTLGSENVSIVSLIDSGQVILNSAGLTVDDMHSGVLPIGFPFTFYGNTYTECVLSTNNYLTFDTAQAYQFSPWFIDTAIPNPGVSPENAIMTPWQDLNPQSGGSIEYGTYGSAPYRIFIARWNGIPMFSCSTITFSSYLFLYEGSNKIETHVIDKPLCTTWNGGYAIHGLVDATSANYNIVTDPTLNQPRNFPLVWSATNDAWEFIPNGSSNYIINQISYSSSSYSTFLTITPIFGCTDSSASNYNATATCDDNSCNYDVYGCTDPLASSYDPLATVDDGSCVYCNIQASFSVNWPICEFQQTGWGWDYSTSNVPIVSWEWIVNTDTIGTFSNPYVPFVDWWLYCYANPFVDITLIVTDSNGCVSSTTHSSEIECYEEPYWNISIPDTACVGDTVVFSDNSFYNNPISYQNIFWFDDGNYLNVYPNQNIIEHIYTQVGIYYPYIESYSPCNYYNSQWQQTNPIVVINCTNIYGCTDPQASNYDATATVDDGSCTYTSVCANSSITGLFISDIIDDQVLSNFDNMNTYDANGTQICRVDQIRIKYREVGTSTWSQKNIASPTGYDPTTGVCNSTQKTDKAIRNLTAATEYEWQVKVWYCNGGNGGWAVGPNFTTLGECPNVGNLTAYGANPTKATFDWDDSNGSYEFARIKMRVDSISNPQGSDWFLVGGSGVPYGTFTKNKNGLTAGETYRAQARTWCDPNGGAYNALS
ncbi:DUF1566 domain-containing protein, partial [Flavobacteriales bacterium]|nr:DUF1566 domain-containing protein [Flavobacteriales bacterium]